jgi:hypothetical protein
MWVRGLDSFGTSLFMAVIARKRSMQVTYANVDLLRWVFAIGHAATVLYVACFLKISVDYTV